MKKILSVIMVMAILLINAVNVFASQDKVKFCEIQENFYLTDDGRLYNIERLGFTTNKEGAQINFVDDDVKFFINYYTYQDIDNIVGVDAVIYLKGDNKFYIYIFNPHNYHTQYFEYDLGSIKPCFITYYCQNDDAYIVIQDVNGDTYTIKSNNGTYIDLDDIKKDAVPLFDGIVKKYDDEFILTDKGTLYYNASHGIYLVSENVIDFKDRLYRTSDNSLYLWSYSNDNKKMMDNCSEFYITIGSGETYIAKSNEGIWYHGGANYSSDIEPDKYVDGNNITPTFYETMIPASQYVYFNNAYLEDGGYTWELDGNLYYNQYEINGNTQVLKNKTKVGDNIINTTNEHLRFLFFTPNGSYSVYKDKWSYSDMVYKDNHNELGIDVDGNLAYFHELSYYTPDVYKIKTNGKFVNCSDWAIYELNEADNLGYIDSVKYFDMNSNINREDFCNMIVDFCETYLGRKLSTTSNPFNDTENEKIIKAYANGIITGVSSNEFSPNARITREQMCAIMMRTTKFLNPNVSFGQPIAFSDMGQVSSWAVEGVNAMSGLGIVKGDGYSITPQSNTSVEQAIAMTYRLYNKIK